MGNRLHPHTLNVLQLGVGFFFIFLAFNSQGFIEESVLDSFADRGVVRKHDGYTSLAIIYASFTLLNFAAPPIIGRIGPRWALVCGGLTYAFFQAGFLFLNRWYLLASSALLGLGASVIWTAQGKYLAVNSTAETAGKHSGLFWALSQACQACGGLFLLAVFLLQPKSEHSAFAPSTVLLLYGAFTAVSVLGVVVLVLLRSAPSARNQQQSDGLEVHPSPNDRLAGDSPSVDTDVEGSESHWAILKSIPQLALSPRMAIFMPVFMYTGLVLSFWSSIYPTSIANTEMFQLNHGLDPKVLLALNAIVQGLGQTGSGFLFGILDSRTRQFGRTSIVFLGALLHLAAFLGVYANLPASSPLGKTLENGRFLSPRIWLALLCGFFLGFGDACWNTQIFSMLIAQFPRQSVQAFSLFKFFQSLLTCAAFFYSSSLSLPWHILILLFGCLIALFAFALAERCGGNAHGREERRTTEAEEIG